MLSTIRERVRCILGLTDGPTRTPDDHGGRDEEHVDEHGEAHVVERVERHQAAVLRGILAAIVLGGFIHLVLRLLSAVSGAPDGGAVLVFDPPDGGVVVAVMGLVLALAIGLQVAVRAPRDPGRVDEVEHRAERVFLGSLSTLVAVAVAFGGWYLLTAPSVLDRAPEEIDFLGIFGSGAGALVILAVAADAAVAANAGLDARELQDARRRRRLATLRAALQWHGDTEEEAVPRAWPRSAASIAVAGASAVAALATLGMGSSLAFSIVLGVVMAPATMLMIHAAIDLLASVADETPLSTAFEASLPALAAPVLGVMGVIDALRSADATIEPWQVALLLAAGVAVTASPAIAVGALLLPLPADRARRPLVAMTRARLRNRVALLERELDDGEDLHGPWESFGWVAIACSLFVPIGAIAAATATRLWRSEHGARPLPWLLRWANVVAWSLPVLIVAAIVALPGIGVWAGWFTA